MKSSRLLTSILTFLLVVNFFRLINGAGFLGSSDVLERLDDFEIDLTPVHNLVTLWQENDYGNVAVAASLEYEELDVSSDGSFSDAGIMTVPSAGGGTNSGGGSFGDPNSDNPIENLIIRIGNLLSSGWDILSGIFGSVGNLGSIFTSFGNLYQTATSAVSKKLNLLGDTVSYLFNNGLSLLLLPIHLLSQTLSFSFWLLGFSA